MQDSHKPISRTTGLARRLLSVFVAAVLCVSLGIPSVAVTDAGFSLEAAHAPAYADEGDGGGTDPEPAPEPAPEKTYVNVPYVCEQTVASATATLQGLGLGVIVNGDTSSTAIVNNQSAYGQVEAGSTITLTAAAPAVPTIYQVRLGYVDTETGAYVNRPNTAGGEVPRIIEKGGKMQMLCTVIWSTGTEGYASDQGVGVSWSVSDTSVATINSLGELTALKDGTITVSCTTQQYGTVTGTIDVQVKGQDGAYVTEVLVTDENGTSYGDNPIVFKERDGTTSASLYATVTYSDGTQKCTWKGDKIANLSWSSSDQDSVYVGTDTGTVKPLIDGSAMVSATVSGGLDGDVFGYVYVNVDTGQFEDGYIPSDSLTVTVVYEMDESVVAEEKTYDVGSLSALGLFNQAYTQVTSNGSFQTVSAQGVSFASVLADVGVNTDEVAKFYFSALDGVNKATVSAQYIFGRTGYYFPNFDQGLLNDYQVAEPMIAVVSKAVRNKSQADFSDLSEGTRFRLCLGSSSATDSSAQKSYKYLSHIWVVMQGSPPLSPDPGDGNDTPSGGGTGITGDSTGSDNGSSTASGTDTTLGLSNQAESYEESAQSADAGASGGAGEGKRWQVFEMMSNAESDIDPIDYHNPLEPFLLPGILAVMVAGGTLSRTRLRREMAV